MNDATSNTCTDKTYNSKETETKYNTNNKSNKTANRHCPLIPGRLTSVNGLISDVCGTRNEYEVAVSIDRALCVYNYRKFTRQFTSSAVLKYEIASIASYSSGNGIVCAGIDAEVHTIELSPSLTATTTTTSSAMRTNTKPVTFHLSHTEPTNDIKKQTQKQQSHTIEKEVNNTSKNKIAQQNEVDSSEGVKGSFRTRINTSAYCERT